MEWSFQPQKNWKRNHVLLLSLAKIEATFGVFSIYQSLNLANNPTILIPTPFEFERHTGSLKFVSTKIFDTKICGWINNRPKWRILWKWSKQNEDHVLFYSTVKSKTVRSDTIFNLIHWESKLYWLWQSSVCKSQTTNQSLSMFRNNSLRSDVCCSIT